MTETLRIYGMADQVDRDAPAPQGVRGERTSPSARDRQPELSHAVTLDNGKRVVVSENSGVAYAEATGRAGRVPPRLEIEPGEPRLSRLPLMVGAIASGLIAGVMWARHMDKNREPGVEPDRNAPLLPAGETAEQQRIAFDSATIGAA